MARPREFDADAALAQIADLFWTQGYEATSISDLEAATGLARARLYGAYGPKIEMLHLAMDQYMEGALEQIFARIESGGLTGITTWFTMIATLREHDPARATKGCLVVNSLVELANTDPEVAQRGDRYRRRVRSVFSTALHQAVSDGEIDGDVTARSEVLLMLLLGMFVSITSGASLDEVRTLASSAVNLVESWRLDAPAAEGTSR